jgi:hypothetical protein
MQTYFPSGDTAVGGSHSVPTTMVSSLELSPEDAGDNPLLVLLVEVHEVKATTHEVRANICIMNFVFTLLAYAQGF